MDNEPNKDETSALSLLVSGGANPLGQLLTRRLVAGGHRVTAMTDGTQGARLVREAGGLPVYSDPARPGEIAAMMKMAKVDAVVHVAPQTANQVPFVPVSYTPAQLLEQTTALAEAARAVGITRGVMVSYASVYAAAEHPDDHLLDETTAIGDSEDPLINAALRAEKVFMDNIPGVVLRAGYVYGPNCPALKDTDQRLKVRTPIPVGEESVCANWVHSSDLVEAIMLALQQETSTPMILNVVDDQPASPVAFATYLATAQGLNPPGRAPGIVERVLNDKQVLFNLDRTFKASNTRAREALGWVPAFTTFEQGVDDVLLTWRAAMTTTSS